MPQINLEETFSYKGFANEQILTVSCTAKTREDLVNLGYEDFTVSLHTGYGIKVDIAKLLDKAGLLQPLIDSINWPEKWAIKKTQ
jgi:hypothetical protein